jgi:uncharacterized membrane protein YuzA (DUF378 family)
MGWTRVRRQAVVRLSKPAKREDDMKSIDAVVTLLLIVGGLNWGLVGLFRFDLVATIFGEMSALSRIVYVLVGVAAVYQGLSWKAIQRRWGLALATSRTH